MPKKLIKLDTLRHSTAHLMAVAVTRLYPSVKLGIGPVIENGFYYDFDTGTDLSPAAFSSIEKEMRAMIRAALPFRKEWLTAKAAITFFQKRKESYKVDLIRELAKKGVKKVSIYWTGKDFADLCTGPHVRNTSDIPKDAFKLTKAASAYWRGNEENPQLSRVYGTVFHAKRELSEYLVLQQELERRDHRKLGRELDLFSFHDVAPGAAFWHPKGMTVVKELENYWRKAHDASGYQEIATPILVKKSLFEQSGHWQYYKENMFHFVLDNETYVLKPMNCPESTFVYNAKIRSFRDLPLRLSEIGRLHRNERSGTLGGLVRVRQMTMDDAHIYCSPNQIEQEIGGALKLVKNFYALFGFEPRFFLATKPDKAMGASRLWQQAEKALKDALLKNHVGFTLKPKDGAFYGPKIDIHISDALRRDWQLATIQLDLVMLPERFDLNYVDRDGKKKRPVVIHRAIFGSFERFIGMLLEHTAGDLPLWLAPVQIMVIPISEKHLAYANDVLAQLSQHNIRAELSAPTETLGKRIRDGELQKIPYLGIVGDREITALTLSLRERKKGDLGQKSIVEIVEIFTAPH